MPNPTDGLFRIEASGLKEQGFLGLQILSMDGKQIQRAQLNRIGNMHKGDLSLRHEPAGIYFIRFVGGEVNEMIRLVKL